MGTTRISRHATRLWAVPIVALLGAGIGLGGLSAGAGSGASVDPDSVDYVLNEGDSVADTVTVTVPAGTGVSAVDIYFLMDTTGSMGGAISQMKTSASTVMTEIAAEFSDVDVAFGAGEFQDFPHDDFAFRHNVNVTTDTAAVQAGIDGWSLGWGGDGPEGQFYAFDQLAENRAPSNDGSPAGTIGWRDGTKRVLVVFGDAPGHDPICSEITAGVDGHELDYDITEASLTQKLVDAGIVFVGISTGFGDGMDGNPSVGDYFSACGSATDAEAGQATRIAEATGGVHLLSVPTDEIIDAVRAEVSTAIETINNVRLVPTGDTAPFLVSMDPADGYGPLDPHVDNVLTFDVEWAGVVAATETDQVFTGTLDALADGSVIADQAVTITVPGLREDEEDEEECEEDGFQVFEPPYINLHPPSNGLSDGIHNHTEKQLAQYIDPLLTGLGLPALQPVVHELNCELIVPVEDAVDDLLIPVVEALDLGTLVDELVGGLLEGLLR